MFSVPQNCLCSLVPLIFRPLSPCSPEINALVPLFPKPLGGPLIRNRESSEKTLISSWQYNAVPGARFTKQLSKNLCLISFINEKFTLIPFHRISKKSPNQNISKLNTCHKSKSDMHKSDRLINARPNLIKILKIIKLYLYLSCSYRQMIDNLRCCSKMILTQ